MRFLGIINFILGMCILAGAGLYWMQPSAGWPLTRALIDAGVGAMCIGGYQMWRHRYVYRQELEDYERERAAATATATATARS